MARFLQRIVEAPRPCSYIAEVPASLEHRILLDVEPDELEALLARGFRRFGPDYFRPACAPCDACISTRIVVPAFQPSRSQRRARSRCARLRVEVGPPGVDARRLALYSAWHADREATRQWSPGQLDFSGYFYQFAFPHGASREILYFDDDAGGRLVAVGICDETPNAWSAIYCFYDPSYVRHSLGVNNVLTVLAIAKAQGKQHVYLGYRVSACPSLRYKTAFHPQEILLGRPADDEPPRWVPSAAPGPEKDD